MKTEAVRHAALHKFAEEDNILAHFLYGNMIVAHASVYFLQIVKFVVMSSEQCLCTISVFVNVLHYRTGNRHSVVSRSTSSDLIEKYQRT